VHAFAFTSSENNYVHDESQKKRRGRIHNREGRREERAPFQSLVKENLE